MTKNQILEDYLNLVYFGNGAYGVQAAAERYFNTPLKKLDLAEAALLAGLIQAPEALNPIKHPDLAARRRGEVLDAMVATARSPPAAAKLAKSVPLPTKCRYPLSRPLDYYIDEVKNSPAQRRPERAGRSRRGARLDTQQARASSLVPRRAEDLHGVRPVVQFIAAEGGERRSCRSRSSPRRSS